MIKPGEIQQKARETGVRDQQIEKDYVLSWILKGISQHENLSKAIAFKGGTVLKKFYFEDYRYSKDIDFTLLDDNITNEQIFKWFKQKFKFIREEANIPLEIIDNNEHEDGGINFYISYIGPLGGQRSNKKVKVDISRSEKMEFEPVNKEAFKVYSDIDDYQLLCYLLEEILIEKMRSVIQRMQARDLYDIWYLLEEHGLDIGFYLNKFKNKCTTKGIDSSTFLAKLSERIPQYKGRWQVSMNDQIKELPGFEKVEREVQRNLKKLKF
jgi:predicted nucleotidyltransferase component of viral defense system